MNDIDLAREIGRLTGAVEGLGVEVRQLSQRIDRMESSHSKRLAAVEKDIYAAKVSLGVLGFVVTGLLGALAWLWDKVGR